MKITTVSLLFCIMAIRFSPISAQSLGCYGSTDFKTKYKIYNTDTTLDFTFTLCRAAVIDFEKISDSDKVVLMTILQNVGNKNNIGAYKSAYKIISVLQDIEDKNTYNFTAVLTKTIASEIKAPSLLNTKQISFALTYGEYLSLLIRDKSGKFFSTASEKIDDYEFGW